MHTWVSPALSSRWLYSTSCTDQSREKILRAMKKLARVGVLPYSLVSNLRSVGTLALARLRRARLGPPPGAPPAACGARARRRPHVHCTSSLQETTMASRSLTSLLTLSLALCALPALAQPKAAPPTPDALKENFLAEHEIGRRFSIDPAQLPAPKSSPIVTNRSLTLPYDGQVPQVPAGFKATLFASGLTNPRRLLVLPNGDVLVAEQSAGYLTLLREEGDGTAQWINRHVEDLNRPYGLAWRNDHVLVADQ